VRDDCEVFELPTENSLSPGPASRDRDQSWRDVEIGIEPFVFEPQQRGDVANAGRGRVDLWTLRQDRRKARGPCLEALLMR
jgi:hypothetical protein